MCGEHLELEWLLAYNINIELEHIIRFRRANAVIAMHWTANAASAAFIHASKELWEATQKPSS